MTSLLTCSRRPDELVLNFLASGLRSSWKYLGSEDNPDVQVYLRLTRRPASGVPLVYLDVANVQVRQDLQRRGLFSRLVDAAERQAGVGYGGVYVKNLLSYGDEPSPLEGYLRRRGYAADSPHASHLPSWYPTSMYRVVSCEGPA